MHKNSVGGELADLHAERGGERAELELLRTPADLPMDSAGRQIALGYLAYKEGDDRAALRHFHRALELHPDSVRSLLAIGSIYLRLGRYSEARDVLSRAARSPAADASVYVHPGFAERELDDLEAAREAFLTALERDPRRRVAYRMLVEVDTRAGRWRDLWRHLIWGLRQKE